MPTRTTSVQATWRAHALTRQRISSGDLDRISWADPDRISSRDLEAISYPGLQHYLKADKNGFTWEQAHALVLDPVLSALAYAHSRGVLHLDVKPENVAIEDDGQNVTGAKVLDFGLARAVGDRALTRQTMVMGTSGYMAPEQQEGRDLGAYTDVYAVAVLAYELLVGRPPRGRFKTPKEHGIAVPDSVDAALMKALEDEPEARYQTVSSFQAALGSAGATGQRTRLPRANECFDVVVINFNLVDDRSTPFSVTVNYSLDNGKTWKRCTPEVGTNPTSRLSSSPNGVRHEFEWDSLADVGFRYHRGVLINIQTENGGMMLPPFDLCNNLLKGEQDPEQPTRSGEEDGQPDDVGNAPAAMIAQNEGARSERVGGRQETPLERMEREAAAYRDSRGYAKSSVAGVEDPHFKDGFVAGLRSSPGGTQCRCSAYAKPHVAGSGRCQATSP